MHNSNMIDWYKFMREKKKHFRLMNCLNSMGPNYIYYDLISIYV
jgi:uncharacterized ferritin-like protein (DUF455 family)